MPLFLWPCDFWCFRLSIDVVMLKKIITLLKYIDLKWGEGRKKAEDFYDCSLIFVDNKQKNFFSQIEVFFKTGFLNKKKTVLVTKFYWSNYIDISVAAEKYGVKVVFYLFYRQIPALDGRVVFYPYNAQANCRLILNRNACHVFLTHGESNKKASVNRMVRLYDYVLAAGEISCQRYLESGVFTHHDIEAGRVIRVGSSLSTDCFEYLSESGEQPCVAYMPTWEGGLEEENFSSIASSRVSEVLYSILNGVRINNILIKCHPNTGSRINSYKMALADLVEKLAEKGIQVYIDPSSMFYLKGRSKARSSIRKNHSQLKIKYGVVDVSAAEFMLAAKNIPTVVLVRKFDKSFFSLEYMRMRKEALIDLDGDASLKEAIFYLERSNDGDEFLSSAFQVEEYLIRKNPKEIGEAVLSKFQAGICIPNFS